MLTVQTSPALLVACSIDNPLPYLLFHSKANTIKALGFCFFFGGIFSNCAKNPEIQGVLLLYDTHNIGRGKSTSD